MNKLKWFFAHILALCAPFKNLVDIDKDGDVDSDDMAMLLDKVIDFLAQAAVVIPEWKTMTPGARVDRVVETMKAEFPKVKTTAWVVLEALGHFILAYAPQLLSGGK
jgi:hypothetical protein